MDIQRWFAIESPKEMSEAFAEISAMYYMTEAGAGSGAVQRAIESRLGSVEDQSEWFAACMCLETVAKSLSYSVRPAGGFA